VRRQLLRVNFAERVNCDDRVNFAVMTNASTAMNASTVTNAPVLSSCKNIIHRCITCRETTMKKVCSWRDDDDGRTYYQYKRAFRIREPIASGEPHYLVYLRKTRTVDGTSLLRMAERYVVKELGGTSMALQDAANITCFRRDGEFDLGFTAVTIENGTPSVD